MKYQLTYSILMMFLTTIYSDIFCQVTMEPDHILVGRDQLPANGETVTDTLVFFDASNGAFRGGILIQSPNWAPDSLGFYSFGYGYNVVASGDDGATALGFRTTASGNDGATALGIGTTASGIYGATALGSNTEARGEFGATAMGYETMTSGDYGATALGSYTGASGEFGATALGLETTASGDRGATALGNRTSASGKWGATALGNRTRASGDDGATALGNRTRASGDDGATALGSNTEATGNSCTVLGVYNDTIVATGTNVTVTSPLFIIGNGDDPNHLTNAMVVRKDGKVGFGTNTPNANVDISGVDNTDAILVDSGQTAIRHHFDFIRYDRDFMHLLIDADNDQTNAKFSIYKDVSNSTGATPVVNFNLNGFDSWIHTGGDFGIGTTDPSAQLHTTGTVRFSHFGAGTLQTDASGNISVSSDERLKNISGEFSKGVSDILKIEPIKYYWNKSSGLEMSQEYAGFSAQNVQQAIPEAVGKDVDGFLTLNDRPIIATLVNAVKEQQQMIENQQREIDKLNTQLSQMHTSIKVQNTKEPN